MPSTTGTVDIVATACARHGQAAEYKEQLARLNARVRELKARRETVTGMERVRLDYDLQVLREMARDTRAAAKISAAAGERKMKKAALDNTANGGDRILEFLAAQRQDSLEESGPAGEQIKWMRQVVADGMMFLNPRVRDMARLYFCGEATQEEIGRAFGVSQPTVSRILSRVRGRLRVYAQDRRRLRRELEGEDLDVDRLLADLRCMTPRQRQVLGLFFDGQRNYEIAIDLHVHPATICRTRQRGAGKLEALGEDAGALRRRAAHGSHALHGPLTITRNEAGTKITQRGDRT